MPDLPNRPPRSSWEILSANRSPLSSSARGKYAPAPSTALQLITDLDRIPTQFPFLVLLITAANRLMRPNLDFLAVQRASSDESPDHCAARRALPAGACPPAATRVRHPPPPCCRRPPRSPREAPPASGVLFTGGGCCAPTENKGCEKTLLARHVSQPYDRESKRL